MNSQSGYTFVDDSQLSVCEKINKYFAKKSVSVINESESDSSSLTEDSFSHLDESFADLLNSNAHVTLMRKSRKEKDSTMTISFCKDDFHKNLAGPNDIRSHSTKWINHEDSFQYDTNNWWDKVTDESFLETERQCNAAYGDEQKLLSLAQSDTTLLFDVEEPSFLDETSICGRQSMSYSMLSPIKQVAMRRPSTILEESTIRSSKSYSTSSEVSNDSSSLIIFEDVTPVFKRPTVKPNVTSYRPSLVNVFPVRTRKGFYDDVESVPAANVSSVPKSPKCEDVDQDNSICLMTFNDTVTEETGSSFEQDDDTRDQFNDTLEAVDYYMEQGKKLMDKTIAVKTPKAIFSPKNRNNSLLKHTLAKRHLRSIGGDSLNMSFFK